MFYKKKINELSNVVSCEECKCLIDKNDAQVVEQTDLHTSKIYFCGKCRKSYSKIEIPFFLQDCPIRYYAKIEVTKDGEPVGYTKNKK